MSPRFSASSSRAALHPRFVAPLLFALWLGPAAALADPRPPEPLDGARLRLAIEKLQGTGSALFVGAHPDDENSAVLTWLANGRKVRTAYLSLTRGDGGQNLAGPDLGERLGVIRTQELLSARRIDDAEQFFGRAIDFGFSKNSDETLAIWGHDAILSDVVRVIRAFRPDVIVTRFMPDSTAGHGHHTASAILAEEAFTAAADPRRYPDQIAAGLRPWQAKRLVWNVYRFGAAGADTTPGRVHVDLGAYDPLLGRSYTEFAGESRSMHKTQGFGAAERRGAWDNAFAHRLGVRAKADLFEGVDLSWRRFPGGEKVSAALEKALRALDPARPSAAIPALLDAYGAMAAIPDEPIVRHQREALLGIVREAAGLWIEAVAARPLASPGSSVRIALSALDRAGAGVIVRGVEVRGADGGVLGRAAPGAASAPTAAAASAPPRVSRLAPNVAWNDTVEVRIAANAPVTGPYWLAEPPTGGMSTVTDPRLIGRPEAPPMMSARFDLTLLGRQIALDVPVVHRWIDPVLGERYRELAVTPPVRMRFDRDFRLVRGGRVPVQVSIAAADVPVRGTLRLAGGDGGSVFPASVELALRPGAPDTTIAFELEERPAPAANARAGDGQEESAAGRLRAVFTSAGRDFDTRIIELNYPHIPTQTLEPPASLRLVRADVACGAQHAGYLMGSGDVVPDALRELGASVTFLDDSDVETADLSRFDVIVVGVRAYNTRPRLRALQPRLLAYVANGGRLVIQYQTPDNALRDRLGPYPFTVSRDRVTVEEAPMRFLKPEHPLLTRPNRITGADFEGWVQERGLWYANPWDARYETVLSANDPGERPLDGGLLYARYGKGTFVYTGLAFFRQLPAGVPGAWRLFANIVSPER